MRSTCYPFYSEETSPTSIPTDKTNLPIVRVDQSYFTLKWNTTISSSLIGESWTYTGTEKADNERTSHLMGYNSEATFTSTKISNTVIHLVSG
jgi:hypothetical protein